MKDAGERVWMILLEKRIGFRLVQKRKQPLGNNGPCSGASVAALKECHRVEWLFRGREMQDVGFPVEDDGEMVFSLLLKRADREVEISRSEREDEIRVRLFLDRHRLRVEA